MAMVRMMLLTVVKILPTEITLSVVMVVTVVKILLSEIILLMVMVLVILH